MENYEKEFGEILRIIKVNSDIFFHIKIYEDITFDRHCHAYIVKNKINDIIYKYNDLSIKTRWLFVKIKNTHFILTRYGL